MLNKKIKISAITLFLLFSFCSSSHADGVSREERKKKQLDELQKRFQWWPTDAKPGSVKDPERGGYWWWPTEPGKVKPWGNRGCVYVYKIIFDYKEEELPPPKPQELRPSLLIKKIIKNVKIYFDYDKANLRDDAIKILQSAVGTLNRNPEASILVTGNCDKRGSEAYNEKLGRRRGEAVRKFMLGNNIPEDRIRIISRGKLDAVAPLTDLVGMQKDRNAHFVIAEVEEVMLPYPGEPEIPEAKKKIILVIEQEINLANGLKSILEKEGYEVVLVFGSYHLKELFQKQKPDLAIIDLYIPRQLGLNILRKTKELFPKLPIIAMTVYTNSFTKKELSRLGADDFVAKPFDVVCLKKRIEALIGKKVTIA